MTLKRHLLFKDSMKYFSCFSWIGGFELWIIQAYESNNEHASVCTQPEQEKCPQGGVLTANKFWSLLHTWDMTAPLCVGFSEIDKYATQIYKKQFPNHPEYGDITAINARELPDFDILVWGFPCQAFSIAWKRKWFEDTRWTLFFELARILEAKKPRLFLFENVKGLISHDNWKTFAIIITTLDELGYDVQWQVLNSKNHWVPQNRERVFIVWNLRGTPRPKVFPFRQNAGILDGQTEPTEWLTQAQISHTLRWSSVKADQTFVVDASYPSRVRKYTETAPTVRDYWSWWNKMPLVGAIRRLTPVECERLQGFPDWWTEWVSDTQRYKCLGNAVTTNVIRDIMKKLLFP